MRAWLVAFLILIAAPASATQTLHRQYVTTSATLGTSANTPTRPWRCDLACTSGVCVFAFRQYATVATGPIVDEFAYSGSYPFDWTATQLAMYANGAYFSALTGTTTGNCAFYK